MSTGFLDRQSDLIRKKWMLEGLIQNRSKSFFDAMTGNSKDSVVYQVNNTNAGDGHTVVFDFDGNIATKVARGKETAYGKGVVKPKFSSKITVERFRFPVDNGDKFDGKEIGDLGINEHADSRNKLADSFIRNKDQAIFDALQGLNGQAATHVINTGSDYGYDTIVDIEKTLRTGKGFTTGSIRRPLDPFKTVDGQECWLNIVDSATAAKLKKSDDFKSLVYNADVRGNQNRAFKGLFGKIGAMYILEAPTFYGYNESSSDFPLFEAQVEMSGLRRKDANGIWSGGDGYDVNTSQTSRNLIVGAGAIQMAVGKNPDYLFQEAQDFALTSESALEIFTNIQKTILKAENQDYKQAKIANIDYGVVAIDTTTS